ncbi:hypothetical protein [Gottschalkia purinilytica]|uniref:hypothetical protein n=1 Tax=Gottschalkia purinilytica TaxID=1503 RepID=UPI0012FEA0FF|nr:hypothetical protein [Gottschalkia purinilytica]
MNAHYNLSRKKGKPFQKFPFERFTSKNKAIAKTKEDKQQLFSQFGGKVVM